MAGLAKAPAALADIIATSSLCYSLGYARTGIRACVTLSFVACSFVHLVTCISSTDSVLKTLIGFVIQRGVLVSLIQTTILITFYASSSHLYWYVKSTGIHYTIDAMTMPTN
jgi:hypothetical protein